MENRFTPCTRCTRGGEVERMNAPRELIHFLMLPHEQQVEAIYRLHRLGWSDDTISRATRLSVEQVRQLIGEQKATDAA